MPVKDQSAQNTDLLPRLFAAGAHFGYSKSRNHPSSLAAIYGYKNNTAMIDLEQTKAQLERAGAYLEGLGMTSQKLLLVGTKPEARVAIERAATELSLPYVSSRWLGGTFTNWAQIKSRIQRLLDLKQQKETGALEVYTKKERLLIDREIARLDRYLSSLVSLEDLPAAVLVVDSRHDAIVVAEARKRGVKVIGLANTDCDLSDIDYPIVMNDTSTAAIRLVLDYLAAAYGRGLAAPKAPASVEPAAPASVLATA